MANATTDVFEVAAVVLKPPHDLKGELGWSRRLEVTTADGSKITITLFAADQQALRIKIKEVLA